MTTLKFTRQGRTAIIYLSSHFGDHVFTFGLASLRIRQRDYVTRKTHSLTYNVQWHCTRQRDPNIPFTDLDTQQSTMHCVYSLHLSPEITYNVQQVDAC